MPSFNIRFVVAEPTQPVYRRLNTELKKEAGKLNQIYSIRSKKGLPVEKIFEVEGSISLVDLGAMLTRVSSRLIKEPSFTILKNKRA